MERPPPRRTGDRRAQRKADDKIIKPHAQQAETEILQDHLRMAVKTIVQQAHIAVIEHCAACLVPHGHKIHDKNEKWQKGHNLPRGLLCFCRVEESEEKPAQEYGQDDQQPDFDGLYQLAAVAREEQGVEIGIALQMRITSGPLSSASRSSSLTATSANVLDLLSCIMEESRNF